jgi:hypothetical protein
MVKLDEMKKQSDATSKEIIAWWEHLVTIIITFFL